MQAIWTNTVPQFPALSSLLLWLLFRPAKLLLPSCAAQHNLKTVLYDDIYGYNYTYHDQTLYQGHD